MNSEKDRREQNGYDSDQGRTQRAENTPGATGRDKSPIDKGDKTADVPDS